MHIYIYIYINRISELLQTEHIHMEKSSKYYAYKCITIV